MDVHSGSAQLLSAFVDSKSQRTRRRRSQSSAEIKLIQQLEEYSSGYFTNGGIAHEKNDYFADGTLFDWAAGSVGLQYSLTMEMWGRGYLSEEEVKSLTCYEQFNPPDESREQVIQKVTSVTLQALILLPEEVSGTQFSA
jgi:hypothetical protein